MRSRSGALHCQTEEELLELAQTTHIGMYYNDQPLPEELKSQVIQGFRQIKNFQNCQFSAIQYVQEETQSIQQEKQLNKGKKYLNCCFVDKEYIKCSIQITILTSKVQQKINKILKKQNLEILFCHTKEQSQNYLFSNYCVQSEINSNVIDIYTFEKETVNTKTKKLSKKMSLKNWVSERKGQKAIELIIINKHISIKDGNDLGHKNIILKYKIWIINPKFLESHPFLQVYLNSSHYIVEVDNKSGSFFQSSLQKHCKVYSKKGSQDQSVQILYFRNVFHNIQAKITKKYMRNLKQILIEENYKQKQMNKSLLQQLQCIAQKV